VAAAEEERRFRELDDDIARIEASLVSIGAKFRGDNYDQKQWSRDDATKASPVSSETDGPKVVWSEDEAQLDQNGDLVLPSAALGAGGQLDGMERQIQGCLRCDLGLRRERVGGRIVFGKGSPTADLVLIGEAPGKNEERGGEPFIGRSGEILDRMLRRVLELSRDEVYVINVLKCRPDKNEDPSESEMDACRCFLDAQLRVVKPKVIVTLGVFATRMLLNRPGSIHSFRGNWFVYRGSIPVRPTFHPSYLLRLESPGGTREETVALRKEERLEKKRVQQDLLKVADALKRWSVRRRIVEINSKR
jgi:uracil-DNA glycosylase